jgi:hypothetical protein
MSVMARGMPHPPPAEALSGRASWVGFVKGIGDVGRVCIPRTQFFLSGRGSDTPFFLPGYSEHRIGVQYGKAYQRLLRELSDMTNAQVVLLIVVIAAVAATVLIIVDVQRSRRLRARFGPEYQRAVRESGTTMRGEDRLAKLEKRVERFNVHPLAPLQQGRFVDEWRVIQARFVDDPKGALAEGDRLLGEIMAARGYSVTDFEQKSADLSVNHPYVVENYRAGHDIALRDSQGDATTEDLRQAMIHYRKLFDDLVGEPEVARSQTAGA